MIKKISYCLAIASMVILFACNSSETGSSQPQSATVGQSGVQDEVSQKTIVQVAVGSPDHTTLVAAVKAVPYVDELSNPGPFTVFAPVNAAFDKLPKGTVETLLKPENKDKLRSILLYHVMTSSLKADFFKDGDQYSMANGDKVTFHVKDGKVKVNDANIVASIPCSNGMIHVVDAVLLPPEKK